MNFVEVVRGIGNVAFVMLIAGGNRRLRRRPRRPSGRTQTAEPLRHTAALHVDDHRDRYRHGDRARS